MNSMNFDELVQLQVLKHKASHGGPSFLIDSWSMSIPKCARCAPRSPQLYAALIKC
jgi:hypothetical protein